MQDAEIVKEIGQKHRDFLFVLLKSMDNGAQAVFNITLQEFGLALQSIGSLLVDDSASIVQRRDQATPWKESYSLQVDDQDVLTSFANGRISVKIGNDERSEIIESTQQVTRRSRAGPLKKRRRLQAHVPTQHSDQSDQDGASGSQVQQPANPDAEDEQGEDHMQPQEQDDQEEYDSQPEYSGAEDDQEDNHIQPDQSDVNDDEEDMNGNLDHDDNGNSDDGRQEDDLRALASLASQQQPLNNQSPIGQSSNVQQRSQRLSLLSRRQTQQSQHQSLQSRRQYQQSQAQDDGSQNGQSQTEGLNVRNGKRARRSVAASLHASGNQEPPVTTVRQVDMRDPVTSEAPQAPVIELPETMPLVNMPPDTELPVIEPPVTKPQVSDHAVVVASQRENVERREMATVQETNTQRAHDLALLVMQQHTMPSVNLEGSLSLQGDDPGSKLFAQLHDLDCMVKQFLGEYAYRMYMLDRAFEDVVTEARRQKKTLTAFLVRLNCQKQFNVDWDAATAEQKAKCVEQAKNQSKTRRRCFIFRELGDRIGLHALQVKFSWRTLPDMSKARISAFIQEVQELLQNPPMLAE